MFLMIQMNVAGNCKLERRNSFESSLDSHLEADLKLSLWRQICTPSFHTFAVVGNGSSHACLEN